MSYKNKNVQVKSNDTNKPKEKFTKKFFKKEINFFSSIGEKSRKLVSNEPNFIIFLIMTFTLSIMFEETGLSRTLPFVLIIPFLIGIFYGRRKATLLHTVVASIILGTVSNDPEITATVIIVGTICTFSGLYLSKYLDHVKRYNIFGKIFRLLFAGIMCIFSFVIYSYYFGVPTDYLKARTIIEEQQLKVENTVYQGIKYNPNTKTYDALYAVIKDDMTFEDKFILSYNVKTDELKHLDEEEADVQTEILEENLNEDNIE